MKAARRHREPAAPRLSGEVQYFRIPRERWALVLDRLIEAGCNTVSTYIPWGWHEPVEGRLDFTGATHPCRDLVGFLKLARRRGLALMARPGPYINAETTGQGHPMWLLNGYPELLVHGADRKPLPNSACYFGTPVSYLNPAYLAKVKSWFTAVCEIYFRHHWIQERFDYEALFKLLTASGLVDINYYWFADGENFEGFGCLGPRQVYGAPITRDGKKRYQYNLLKENNRFILKHPELHDMRTRYRVALTYDEIYSQASRFASPYATDWHSEFIHGEENMGGLIDLLGAENIAAQMIHIADDWSKVEAPALVIAAYDYWRRGLAAKVRDYVEAGGDVVIFGRMPRLDERLNAYSELAEWCGIHPDAVYPECQRALRTVSVVRYEGEDYQFHSKVQTYRLADGAEPIAHVGGGSGEQLSEMKIAGARVKRGKGTLRVFGAIPRLFMEASRTFIRAFLDAPDPRGLYRYERVNDTHTFTTLLNVTDADRTARMGGRTVRVPRRSARFVWQSTGKPSRSSTASTTPQEQSNQERR